MIYFDSAATTLQKPDTVPRAVEEAIRTMTTPGRGDYPAARKAAELMFRLRTTAAELFDVQEPDNVVLTGNATHGLNIAIKSLVHPGDHVVISGYEHNAVTRPLHAIGDVHVTVVNGRLFDREQMLQGFMKAVTRDVKAVICTQVSNVFGYALPIDEIAALCRDRGVPLIVDASQAAGILPVKLDEWGAAFVAMPGHKGLYGPQGTGLLLCGQTAKTSSLLEGGTGSLSRLQDMPEFLPDRLEAGTHNIHGAAGLLAGLEFVRETGMRNIAKHEAEIIRALGEGLRELGGCRVYGGPDSSVLSIVPWCIEVEPLAELLASEGIAVRAGLHCAPLAHMTAGTAPGGTLRFSASWFNTMDEVEEILRHMPRP